MMCTKHQLAGGWQQHWERTYYMSEWECRMRLVLLWAPMSGYRVRPVTTSTSWTFALNSWVYFSASCIREKQNILSLWTHQLVSLYRMLFLYFIELLTMQLVTSCFCRKMKELASSFACGHAFKEDTGSVHQVMTANKSDGTCGELRDMLWWAQQYSSYIWIWSTNGLLYTEVWKYGSYNSMISFLPEI